MNAKELLKEFSVEDIHWIGSKLKGDFLRIDLNEKLTARQKDREIEMLVQRARRLGFEELISYMGWMLYKIPISEGRDAEILFPKDITSDQKREMINRILIHLEAIKSPEPVRE